MAPRRTHMRDIYSKLFRPEWLMRYPHRLSSDAFSGFGRLDYEVSSSWMCGGVCAQWLTKSVDRYIAMLLSRPLA
jgi:hypothetical protein